MVARLRCWAALSLCMAAPVAFVGCGAEKPSTSGAVLEMVDGDDAAVVGGDASEAFAKAVFYADLARQSQDEGDAAAAERYAFLARHHREMARLHAEKIALQKRMQAASEQARQLGSELENLQLQLDREVRKAARTRLREHVAGVISEARLRAAAEEEARLLGYTGREKRAVAGARTQVARAMIARAMLWVDVLRVLVPKGADSASFTSPVALPIAAAEASLASVDPALVQEYVETAGAAFANLWAHIWDGAARPPDSIVTEMQGALDESFGRRIIAEPFCVAVPLTEDDAEVLPVLVAMAERHAAAGLVWLAPDGDPRARTVEGLRAAMAAQLAAAGGAGVRFHSRDIGDGVPFAAFANDDVIAVVLIIPGPTRG